MELVSVVTKTFVYAIGFRLPVPPGYIEEPFIATSMRILDDSAMDDGEQKEGEKTESEYMESTTVRIVCEPDMEAATTDPVRTDEMGDAEFDAIASYHTKAKRLAEDKMMLVVDIPITEDTRLEYLTTEAEYYGTPDEPKEVTEKA